MKDDLKKIRAHFNAIDRIVSSPTLREVKKILKQYEGYENTAVRLAEQMGISKDLEKIAQLREVTGANNLNAALASQKLIDFQKTTGFSSFAAMHSDILEQHARLIQTLKLDRSTENFINSIGQANITAKATVSVKGVKSDQITTRDDSLTTEQREQLATVLNALIGIIIGLYFYALAKDDANESEYRLMAQHKATQEMVVDIGDGISSLTEQINELQEQYYSIHEKLEIGSESELRIIAAKRGAHLRDSPEVKSESLAIMPYKTKITVLDKSNRNWLLVEIKKDGFPIIGWTNRKLTKPLKTSNQG